MDQSEAEVRRLIESSNTIGGGNLSAGGFSSSSMNPTSSYGAASFVSGYEGAVGGTATDFAAGAFDSATYGIAAGGGGSYESSTFESGAEFAGGTSGQQYISQSGGDFGGFSGAEMSGAYDAFGSSGGLAVSGDFGGISAGEIDQSHSSSSYSSYRIQQDPNPTVIRRPMAISPQVYRQNIQIRFLRPPQLPPPGPLIVREVRPPQPPPAPPLIIRQRPPRPPQLPPLILREKPPRPPAILAQKIITKRLPPLPPPPRQVIIERYPPLPPKPRDIIIERWLPYGPMPKRKVIYQRAAAAHAYRTAKNMIICYETTRPRIERVFRKLGVTMMEPRVYMERYGMSLLDANILVSQARNYGVVEDISPPAIQYGSYGMETAGIEMGGFSSGGGETSFTQSSSTAIDYGSSGAIGGEFGVSGDLGGALSRAGLDASAYDVVGGAGAIGGDSQFSENVTYRQYGSGGAVAGATSGVSYAENESYRVESSGGAAGGYDGVAKSASYSSKSESVHGV